jgi:hypothetical protein
MQRNVICASASSTPGTPGLLTGALSIAAVDQTPPQYELKLNVESLGAGILRAAIVDVVPGVGEAPASMLPICMINVEGPIGGPPGTVEQQAPATMYSQSWTQSDAPGVRFGATGATLGVYVYESDTTAVISAEAIY